MATSIIIKRNEFINFLNDTFKNINLSNKEYIDNLLNEFIENKNKTYYYNKYKKLYVDSLKYLNSSKPTLYKQYWLIRGWNEQEAENHIRKFFRSNTIYFNKDEIFNDILNNGLFGFNQNNPEFIKKFVDTIIINDHIATYQIQSNFLSNWCNNFYGNDKCNLGYITAQKCYYIARGYSEDEAKNIITQLQKEKTPRCKEYFKKRGLCEKDANIKVSEYQSNNSSNSKGSKKYWLKLGLSEEDAIEKSKYYNSQRSVWGRTYWMNQGLSEEEALEKTHEYNASCKECKCYNNDIGLYINHINNLKEKQELIWKTITKNKLSFIKNVSIKTAITKNVSKSEKRCFDYLIENIDQNIQHSPYVVLFPEGFVSKLNNYFYACDGYLQVDNNKVIIIEYDGGIGIFHTPEKDLQRDNEILLLDDNVLGIIHIQETFFKNTNIIDINKTLNYAIQKIKNCEEERITIA